jgi:type IV secretion system protein TrbL
MNPSDGVLTDLITAFHNVFSAGFGFLTPKANTLLGLLAAIEIAVAGLFWALKGQDFTASFIKKLLHIGFFVFLVANWPALTDAVVKSFVMAGATAAGGTTVNIANPSWIVQQGLLVSTPISDKLDQMSTTANPLSVLNNLGQIIQYGIALIIIIIAFFVLAIQCFITYVEFYIVAVLGLILVPFGVNKHTAFLAEKAIGAVIAQGVKLMVLAFILSVVHPLLVSMTLPADPSLKLAYELVLAALAIAFLAVHAPALAGGLLSGSPSLNAGSAAGVAIGAAAGFAGVGIAGIAAKNAAASGAGKTIQAAGAMSEAGNLGATAAAGAGAGPVGIAASRMASAAYGGARQAAKPVENIVTRMADRFKAGRLDGARFMGNRDAGNGTVPGANGNTTAPPPSSAPNATSSTAPSAPANPPATPISQPSASASGAQGNGMTAVRTANQAVQNLTHSSNGGSGSPTLPKDTDEA